MSEYETTLLLKPQCFVYKIPPRTQAKGYRAKEWNLSDPLWTGRLVIKSVGVNCAIRLENADGSSFASCPVFAPGKGPEAVEKVLDSSRYFVLRIEDDSGRAAFIGMGFNERNDAFDFTAAIQDHQRYYEQQEEIKKNAAIRAKAPAKDYSLKAGETLTISIPTKKNNGGSSRRRRKYEDDDDGDDLFLPPPPDFQGAEAPQAVPQSTGQGGDLFGFGAMEGGPTGSQPPQQGGYPPHQSQSADHTQAPLMGGVPAGGQTHMGGFAAPQQPGGGYPAPQQPGGGYPVPQQPPGGGQQAADPFAIFGGGPQPGQPVHSATGGPQAYPGAPLERQTTPQSNWPF